MEAVGLGHQGDEFEHNSPRRVVRCSGNPTDGPAYRFISQEAYEEGLRVPRCYCGGVAMGTHVHKMTEVVVYDQNYQIVEVRPFVRPTTGLRGKK